MTVIAAVQDPESNCTWIGADSMTNYAGTCLYTTQKWVTWNGWGIASAGDHRTNSLLLEHVDRILGEASTHFEVAENVRSMLQEDGYNQDHEEGAQSFGQQMIIANHDGVWAVSPSFALIDIKPGELWADGSGRAFALGAAYSVKAGPREKIEAAIDAAIRYDDSCGGDPKIASIGA